MLSLKLNNPKPLEQDIYSQLKDKGLLSDESYQKLKTKSNHSLFSVHWELNLLLYLGVLMFTGGLGILVYKNIDTIGHQAVLALIAVVAIGCFFYCFKHKAPFSRLRVKSPNMAFDYVLLLGSILLVTFIGYLQYQYNLFGNNYGLATFIPMVLLFYIAYDFDHLGILSMAIANLAVWMGVSITPKTLLMAGSFSTEKLIYTYLALGILLLAAAYLTHRLDFKRHFKFNYHNYGAHITFIALLSGFFHFFDSAACVLWAFALFGVAAYIYLDGRKHRSFYFILIALLYSYIALCGLVGKVISSTKWHDIEIIYFAVMLFIASAVGLIILLININKNLKADDHI
ncbi:DUF2157 domain-containing protein [Mucilaginibacter litoreus]|uniref:DUF2157 domain-containing protein n=1 Tax=Mucilaginibacter litoreus TaxID=1048221 RepID=A0ABW3AP18_9SPHI